MPQIKADKFEEKKLYAILGINHLQYFYICICLQTPNAAGMESKKWCTAGVLLVNHIVHIFYESVHASWGILNSIDFILLYDYALVCVIT